MRESLLVSLCCVIALASACGEERDPVDEPTSQDPADPGEPGEPGAPAARPAGGIVIDTSSTSPFVVGFPESHVVSGVVTAAAGVSGLTVDGASAAVGEDGGFSQPVAVAAGLNVVEITATDGASPSNSRDGHLSLLVADYRPEGEINPAALSVELTEEMVAGIAESAAAGLADADLTSALLADGSISQDGCDITITSITHDPPEVALSLGDPGELRIEVVVPGLHADFEGTCTMLVTLDVTGTMDSDFLLRTAVTAPPGETCIESFAHSEPEVELRGFDLALAGGGLLGFIVPIIGEMAEGDMAASIQEQVAVQADAMIAEQLASISLFEMRESVDLLGASAEVQGCLTGIDAVGEATRAVIGMSVDSGNEVAAPGAPFLPRELPASTEGLLLDAAFVGQLMYSAWAAGLLDQAEAAEVDFGLIAMLAPELRDLYEGAEVVTVGIEGALPPLVTAAPAEQGDLLVEIGNLDVILSVEGDEIFRVGAHLTATVELQPEGEALRPVVTAVESSVCVLDETVVDMEDEALEQAIEMQIGDVVDGLLGEAAIALPDTGLGVSFAIADVSPLPGTGYLLLSL